MSYQLPTANAYFRLIPYEHPVNGKLNPHEGREFELLLSGEKHMLCTNHIPADFQAHIDSGEFKTLLYEINIEGITAKFYTVYRSGHESDAEYLHEITTNPKHFWRDWEGNVRETGRLLGYKAEDIQAMVDVQKWQRKMREEKWRPANGSMTWNMVLVWSYPSKVPPFSCMEGKRKMQAKAAAVTA